MPRGLRPIGEVGAELGLHEEELVYYGPHKAKVRVEALTRRRDVSDGRVVLVTAITPTPAGEGKTVTAIALAQALRASGSGAAVCLREPSMGPVFGLKGGATGGGRCTVEPAEDINLHFTGDLHAVTAANNLLAALVDEHLYRCREPHIDPRKVAFRRVVDVNDRALRHAVVGLGGGLPREEHVDITAASEVMAVLGLAGEYSDLRRRCGRILVGRTRDGRPVTAEDLRAAGAMAALLRDALMPNLVQTQDGTAAFVHAGPFANIAHGTSSLVSLRLAQKLVPIAVVEAGFGADLGAEKFVHVVGAHGGPQPHVAVVVVTARALKHHAGIPSDGLAAPNPAAVRQALAQVRHHVDIVRRLGMRPVVCVNAFSTDAPEEIRAVVAASEAWGVPAAVSRGYELGAEGALDLAEVVRQVLRDAPPVSRRGLYAADAPLAKKLEVVASEVYRASGVEWSDAAQRSLEWAEAWGFGGLPVCVAKTQYSLTDDPTRRGVPTDFTIRIRDVAVRAGAGFVLAVAGEIMTMPALPPRPRAWDIDLDADGAIRGVT
ncbi:MAG: formate--tetrahydrofolate ligase [Armatimonadota bacterium]|nr:formate--tetrahydrofolate ligase [Armatimonadota bacterium]MDR5697556.1 formate--tetrahydrofolate ligase [Armatimonadota bacterium]